MSTTPTHLRKQQGARLRQAREDAFYSTATQAAADMKVNRDTYVQHENGTRSFTRMADIYAAKLGVSPEWLLWGRNPPDGHREDLKVPATDLVPVVGYVGAGAVATLYADGQGPLDHVDPPSHAGPETVAVEIKGVSLGPAFDNGLVFYDDVHQPVTPDQLGKLCVVGLPDGRVLVKIVRMASDGRFHLLSNTAEEPILDQEVTWAAKVTDVRLR